MVRLAADSLRAMLVEGTIREPLMSPIRLRVQELRTARGWSLRELARRAGIRHATLSRIENGQTSGVDFAVLERLAEALEVDAGYLVVHERRAPRR